MYMSSIEISLSNPSISVTVTDSQASSNELSPQIIDRTIYDKHFIEDFETRYQRSYHFETTIDLTKFELIRTLGQGSFGKGQSGDHFNGIRVLGRVILVVFDSDNIEYALKVLDKSKIVKYNQSKHVQSELRILKAIKHPNGHSDAYTISR